MVMVGREAFEAQRGSRPRHWVIASLRKEELRWVATASGVWAPSRLRVDELRRLISDQRGITFLSMLEALRSDSLARLLRLLALPSSGTRTSRLDRLVAAVEDWDLLFEAAAGEEELSADEWTPTTLALASLPKTQLMRLARRHRLQVSTALRVSELGALLASTPTVSFETLLASLDREGLRRLSDVFEFPRSGTKEELRSRLLLAQAEWYEDREPEEAAVEAEAGKWAAQSYVEAFERDFVYRPDQRGERRPYQEAAVRALLRRLGPERPSLLHVATGGGKTWIANDAVMRWRERYPEAPVLWVTKDWRLLWQAARDVTQRHRGMRSKLTRIGGGRGPLRPLARTTTQAAIIYTTLQTLASRIGRRQLRTLRPSLLVWDECHWGQTGASGRRIVRWCRQREIPVLGLTATPRPSEHSVFDVVYRKGFPSLVKEGFLARPRLLEPVHTGVEWAPERIKDGDFRLDSLAELADNGRRNGLIIDHYARNQQRYGRTIVYACSVEHADLLATQFKRRKGVAARPVHSGQDERTNQLYIEQFHSGEVKVLVNVAMLTHGVDVPETQTIFLCRPTLSDVLFAQMIGRAARRVEGKDEFYIVEFTDNLSRLGEQLRTSQTYFYGTCWSRVRPRPGDSRGRSGRRSTVTRGGRRHSFDPRGAAAFIPDTEEVDPAIRGLWYRTGQTFGVELELTHPDFVFDQPPDSDWERRAEVLLEALRRALPQGAVAPAPFAEYHAVDRNDEHWNLEWDRTCGWEVTSRVLADRWGFEEVVAACGALRRAAARVGLRVDHRTGLHLHIGWLGRTTREVRRAIKLARLFEPALATMVAPSRVVQFDGADYDTNKPNEYCQPLSTVFCRSNLVRLRSLERLWELSARSRARHLTFSITPLDSYQTVEVRMHGGTLEARKVLLWLSLWQQMLWCAASPRRIPEVPDVAVLRPTGDVVDLARRFLPAGEDQAFLARLDLRRRELLRSWQRTPALEPWCDLARQW